MAKITFVGAGSVVFSKNLICDILQNRALEASTICLMDIDPARLKIADLLAKKVVAQLGVKARVESTLDLKAACAGARYVVTMIQVGGYRPATVTDFEIPKKYGLRQTIADTLGVGGVFRALRTMPELVKVGNMLRDHGADNPMYLNYSNPMAMNMMAIDRVCGVPSVGLCHSVQGTSRQLADYLGLPYEDISYKVAGINHVAFFLKFQYRGQDAYPLLFEALENPRIFSRDKVRFEMMRRLGYFVTESSEHFSEYCPWFIHHGPKVIEAFDIPLDEYLRRCESIIATWKETEKKMLADGEVSIGHSVEYGSQIINAMECGEPVVIYGNVPNAGLITNLPNDCCVEVPCVVDSQGLQPTVIGDLPPQLAAMCRTNIAVQELAVEAFLTGKREHIYHAVMMDPHASSQLTLDQIWKMCDELIEAHQKDGYLPQFAPVQKNTGRSRSSLEQVRASIEERADSKTRTKDGCHTLNLVVKNSTSSRFKGRLHLVLDSEHFRILKSSTFACNVPSGQTKRLPFSVQRLKAGADLKISIESSVPGVFKRNLHLPTRAAFPANPSVPLTLDWSGNRLAEGALTVETSGLKIHLRVMDTNIHTVKESFWEASALEFFFARPEEPDAAPVQLVALPAPGKAGVISLPDKRKAAGTRMKVKADKGGYTTEIFLPYASAGILPGKPFLMEMIVRVSALGDAHGKVSSTWQASANPQMEKSRYAKIEI